MSAPSPSKNRMITESGSSGLSRSVMPAETSAERQWNRVSGTLATSRSITLMPPAFSPAIIARFNMRAARLESRETTTVASFFSDVANASATFAASSGVASTFARPDTPPRPNRLRAPRDSQISDVLTTAPASTVLNGYTLTSPDSTAFSPTKTSSPSTTPSSQRTPRRRSEARPTTAPRIFAFSPM